MKHFLRFSDLGRPELEHLMARTRVLKERFKNYVAYQPLVDAGELDGVVVEIAVDGSRAWMRSNLRAFDADRHGRFHDVIQPGSGELQNLFARGFEAYDRVTRFPAQGSRLMAAPSAHLQPFRRQPIQSTPVGNTGGGLSRTTPASRVRQTVASFTTRISSRVGLGK